MSQIKKFIDRVAMAEGRQSREVLMSLADAKELRDEITRLLVDKINQNNDATEVVMNGGKW